jgi:putative membrane protein
MIDYVTLLLVNMVAGLVVLAFFLWWGLGHEYAKDWAPAFGIAGLVATVAGFAMTFTWPIPKPFSMAYGEMSVLLGVLLLGAAWALASGWSLLPLSIYAFFAGLAAIVIGVRFIHLSLTPMPFVPATGFILTGLAGVCAGVVLRNQESQILRFFGVVTLLAAAFIWAFTAYVAYWNHMKVERPAGTVRPVSTPVSRAAPEAARVHHSQSPFNAAQVSGTTSGTAARLARAAITQYMQNARYHPH